MTALLEAQTRTRWARQTAPCVALGSYALNLQPSTMFHHVCVVASCADVMLPHQGRLARHAIKAAARFVG